MALYKDVLSTRSSIITVLEVTADCKKHSLKRSNDTTCSATHDQSWITQLGILVMRC